MRVAVVSNLYPPDVLGGYELLARDVTERLRARGHDVDVICAGEGTMSEGCWRVLRLSRPFGSPARRDRARHALAAGLNARAIAGYLRARGRPDAVLAMSQRRLGLEPLRAFARAGAPIVATVNDDWPVAYVPRSILDRTLGRLATWWSLDLQQVVYLSDAVRRHVKEAGAPLPDGIVQAQGVDRLLFTPRPPRPVPRAAKLLVVGRLHPSKAPDAAIDALAELPEATLTFAGAPVDAAYDAALRARAVERRVEDRIRWLGAVPRERLPDVYRDADVLLFPNRFEGEGQGLTYLEAMSCGVPVVAHPTGGARDLLAGSGAAIEVEACDGPSFARGVRELVAIPDLAGALRAAAFDLLDRRASLDAYVTCLERELRRAR